MDDLNLFLQMPAGPGVHDIEVYSAIPLHVENTQQEVFDFSVQFLSGEELTNGDVKYPVVFTDSRQGQIAIEECGLGAVEAVIEDILQDLKSTTTVEEQAEVVIRRTS